MGPRTKNFQKGITVFCLLWVHGLGSIVYGQSPSIPPQTLHLGDSATLPAGYEIGDVAVTNPKVVDFVIPEDRRQIYLNAKGEGFATVTLWDAQGNAKDAVSVTVYGSNLQNVMAEAKREFGSIDSIYFMVEGEQLTLLGEAPSPSVYKRLEAFVEKNPQVVNEVAIAEPALDTMTSTIERAVAIPGVKVRSIRNQIILEGVAYSQAQANKAFEIAKLYAPDCLNLIEVREKDRTTGKDRMVQLDFYFMEIQKSALKAFGIQWAPGSFPKGGAGNVILGGGDGGGGIGGLGQSLLGFVLNLLPKIKLAKEHGLGRVLENPTLFVKSGDPAQFFSGVQIPYVAKESVEFKEVGVKVEAEPIAAGKDVDLRLTATISSPSPHIEGGINTHTVSTTAYIPSDHAVVLGGILSNRDVKTYNRIPRDLITSSALFTLFLSKDFQTSKSELVVFVLPRIVEQPAEAALAQKDWAQLEEQIIRDRSMKEYLEYMKEKGREPKKRKRHRR